MPCNKLAIGGGKVTVDPNILHENPQAKVALGTLAMQAIKLAYQTHRPALFGSLVSSVEASQFRHSREEKIGCEVLFPGCHFYRNGWANSGNPEWYFGPITVRLYPDGSLEYRDGDWISGQPGKFTQEELQHFIAQMDLLIPQLATAATVESIVQRVGEIAPIQQQQWLGTARVLTINL